MRGFLAVKVSAQDAIATAAHRNPTVSYCQMAIAQKLNRHYFLSTQLLSLWNRSSRQLLRNKFVSRVMHVALAPSNCKRPLIFLQQLTCHSSLFIHMDMVESLRMDGQRLDKHHFECHWYPLFYLHPHRIWDDYLRLFETTMLIDHQPSRPRNNTVEPTSCIEWYACQFQIVLEIL